MREPQCFSTCLSVPGFAWLDRKDSKQASACWSVSVGGLPLEPYPRIYDSAEGSMQRSRPLTPTPAATLSCSPGESLVSSSGEQAIFPGFSRLGTHRWRPAQICDLARRPHATFAYAHSCGYAIRFAKRVAFGSPGRKAIFPGFSRLGTHR